MDKVPRIKELYRELSELHEKMKPFFIPQTVEHHHKWTQADADYYLNSTNARAKSSGNWLILKADISSNTELAKYRARPTQRSVASL